MLAYLEKIFILLYHLGGLLKYSHLLVHPDVNRQTDYREPTVWNLQICWWEKTFLSTLGLKKTSITKKMEERKLLN